MSPRNKILFLTPHTPSDSAGGAKYTKSLLQNLSINLDIDLIYFRYSTDEVYNPPQGVNILKIYKNSFLLKILRIFLKPFLHPIFSVRYSLKLIRFLKKQQKKETYNFVYIDHSQMFIYARLFKKEKIIMMAHDVMAERFGNSNSLIKKIVQHSEYKMLTQNPNATIFTFSEKDVNLIKKYYNINNTFSTTFFLDNNVLNAVPQKIDNNLIFFGNWGRADNSDGLLWFIEEIMPTLSNEIKIIIIGGNMPQNILEKISNNNNINYMGFVENPYNIIAQSQAVIAPLFSGAGVKVKVVESLACGTPVIGTPLAFEGIESDNKNFLISCNTKDDFFNAIQQKNCEIIERLNFKCTFVKKYTEKIPLLDYIDKIGNGHRIDSHI